MKLFGKLFSREPVRVPEEVEPLEELEVVRAKKTPQPQEEQPQPKAEAPKRKSFFAEEVLTIADSKAVGKRATEILEKITAKVASSEADAPKSAINIWDLDGNNPPATIGAERGFVMDEVSGGQPNLPVGWLTVTEGPGRGACFTLAAGMSQIGSAEGQAVRLKFGDASVRATNHAAIIYSADANSFSLSKGGKGSIVALNDMPVKAAAELRSGDVLTVGETQLRFTALCDEAFCWPNRDAHEGDGELEAAG